MSIPKTNRIALLMSGIDAHSKDVSIAILKSPQVDKQAECKALNNHIAAWQGTSSETQESTLTWKKLRVDSLDRFPRSLRLDWLVGFHTLSGESSSERICEKKSTKKRKKD